MKRPLIIFIFSVIHFCMYAQDLVVSDVSGAKTFERYAEFTTYISVENVGIVSTNSFYNTTFFFSKDSILDSNDFRFGIYFQETATAAGETRWMSFTSSVSVPEGEYFFIVKVDVDRNVNETDEENNVYAAPGYVVTAPDVDWEFTAMTIPNKDVAAQDRTSVKFSFRNNGSVNAGGSLPCTFYLSADNIFDSSDIEVSVDQSVSVSGWDYITNKSATITIPYLPPGDYFIFGKLDDRNHQSYFVETNENNNVSISDTVHIGEPDIDLVVADVQLGYYESFHYGSQIYGFQLQLGMAVKNVGTTGHGLPIATKAYLSTDQAVDSTDFTLTTYSDGTFDYAAPGDTTYTRYYPDSDIYYSLDSIPQGDYYLFVKIQPWGKETDNTNNFSAPKLITIGTLSPSDAQISNADFSSSYHDADTNLDLTVFFTNTGSDTFSGQQEYQVEISDINNTVLFSTYLTENLSLAQSQNTSSVWHLVMSSPLIVGDYTLRISCRYAFNCFTSEFSLPLNISPQPPSTHTLSGHIQGEDGTPVTKGKLFLYQKDDYGTVKFIQKIVPTLGSDFDGFVLDNHRHTLYFIPDRALYPQHIPTIFGKTVTLQQSNFITISSDTSVVFQILKLSPLAAGDMSIVGSVLSGGTSSSGRARTDHYKSLTTLSEPVPIILLSDTGEPVALTYTDEDGNYSFHNLPADKYQLVVASELDQTIMESPLEADVTQYNVKIDFVLDNGAIIPTPINLQEIEFGSLDARQYKGEPFDLAGTSSSGLPVYYSSSNPEVATVDGNTVTIIGVGNTTITARQEGNTSFAAATPVEQTLVIGKANQSITFEALPDKTFGDAAFDLSALASSGLAVEYTSSNHAVAVINGNNVTIKGVGSTKITATQLGNDNYNSAVSVTQTLNVLVLRKDQTIEFSALPVKHYGDQAFDLTAKSSSGLTITYASSNNDVATVYKNRVTIKAPGITTIKASQQGNAYYHPATPVEQELIVEKKTQDISFGGIPQTIPLGSSPFILGASSSSGLSVQYTSSDPEVAIVNVNEVSIVGRGWATITASQSGNSFYDEAEPVSKSFYVSLKLQSILFDALDERTVEDGSFELQASASSNLPVNFSSSNPKVATVNDNIVTIRGAGVTEITAMQTGNEEFEPASPVSRPLTVNAVTSIDEGVNENAFDIYPNPTTSSVTILARRNSPKEDIQIIITDSYGKKVLSISKKYHEEVMLDLSTLSGGVYSISILQKGFTSRKRLVKY